MDKLKIYTESLSSKLYKHLFLLVMSFFCANCFFSVHAKAYDTYYTAEPAGDGWVYEYRLDTDGNASIIGAKYCTESEDVSVALAIPAGVEGHTVTEIGSCGIQLYINIPGSVESITIPNTVKTIYSYALSSTEITEITIPAGVEYIGHDAFNTALKSITFEALDLTIDVDYETNYNVQIPQSATIDDYLYVQNKPGYLFWINDINIVDGNIFFGDAIVACKVEDKKMVIPSSPISFKTTTAAVGLTTINVDVEKVCLAECDYSDVNEVVIPEGINYINSNSFSNMTGLTEITIPKSVEYIGKDVFNTALETITFTEPEITIDVDYDTHCDISLPTDPSYDQQQYVYQPGYLFWQGAVNIADGNIIFDDAVVACKVDNHIMNIPSTFFGSSIVSSIETKKICLADYNYSDVETICIRENITYIDASCFAGMSNLTSFEVYSNDNYRVVESGSRDPYTGSVNKHEKTYSVLLDQDNNIVKWPCKCDRYVEVDFESTVSNVKGIGAYAFAGCTNLNTLVFPSENNGIYVQSHAFSNCTSLKYIEGGFYFEQNSNSYYNDTIFEGVSIGNLTIIITNVSGGHYSSRLDTVTFALRQGITYKYLMNLRYVSSGVELTAYNGLGKNVYLPNFAWSRDASGTSIDGQLTSIAAGAFRGNTTAEEIRLPDSIQSIDNNPFAECSKLKSLYLYYNNNYTSYNGMLTSYDGRELVVFPAGVGGTINLNYMSASIEKICAYAFSGCRNIDYLYIPSGITEIEDNAFTDNGDMILVVESGSVAENYAIDHNLSYLLKTEVDTYHLGCEFVELNDGTYAVSKINIPSSSQGDVTIHIPAYAVEPGIGKVVQIGIDDTDKDSYLFDYVSTSVSTTNSYPNIKLSIPSTVSKIAESVNWQSELSEITVDDNNEYFKMISNSLVNTSEHSLVYAVNKNQTNYSIPDGVNYIYPNALINLYYSGRVQILNIPSSMEDLSSVGLQYFSNLKNCKIAGGNSNYCSVDGVVFSRDMKTLVYFPPCIPETSYTIPENVEIIAEKAFSKSTKYSSYSSYYGTTMLSSITIPTTIKEIGDGAFSGSSISKVVVEEGMTDLPASIFSGCSRLSTVELPSTLKKIGESAFSGCSNLSNINIPDSVDEIGDKAFERCRITAIKLPPNITQLSNGVFSNCSNLTEIEMSDNITEIGDRCFYYCNSLKDIELPSSLTTIGGSCFYGCTSLTAIELPSTITTLGSSCFSGCTSLVTIELPSSLTTIGGSCFYGCTSLTAIELPSTITTLGSSCFSGCTSLVTIELPSSLTTIGERCFSSCTSLVDIVIPDNITIINPYCFFGCTKLTSVTMGNNITKIGNHAFYDCSSLTAITLSNKLTELDKRAFCLCSALESIELPETLEIINNEVFYLCKALESVTIPSNVKTVNQFAFAQCNALATVKCDEGVEKIDAQAFAYNYNLSVVILPESINEIKANSFYGYYSKKFVLYVVKDSYAHTYAVDNEIPYTIIDDSGSDSLFEYNDNGNGTATVTGYTGTSTSVEIPGLIDGLVVTNIGDEAFLGNESIEEVDLPVTIQTIGVKAFSGCSKLQSISMSDKITSIGQGAFSGCHSINSIKLSSSLKSISDELFMNCDNLEEVEFGKTETDIGARAFSGCVKLTTINIPGSINKIDDEAIKDCTSLNSININKRAATSTYITRDNVVGCNSLTEIKVVDSLSTNLEDKEGVLYNKNTNTLLWYPEALEGDYEIPEGTEEIASKAFYNCKKLGVVTVPATVTTIATDAFDGCGDAFRLNILEGNTEYSITEKILFNSDRTVINGVIGEITGELVIPDTVITIAEGAFAGQDKITSVKVPASVESISKDVFADCTSLTDVVIEEGVNSISAGAFKGCTELKDITIPESVQTISNTSFENCNEDIKLHVQYGSVAWEYARSNGFSYELPTIAITGITLEQHSLSMKVGSTTVIFIEEILPKNANEAEQWFSSDEDVVKVNSSGVVTAVSEGTARVSVCNSDKSIVDSCEITVVENTATSEVYIEQITLENKALNMTVGDLTVIDAVILPEDTTEDVTWNSSDTEVVTVNSKGVIKAISKGEADITVSNPDGTIKAVCKVTVAPKEEDNTPKTVTITTIKFAQEQMELKIGDLTVLEPEILPEDTTENVTWSSSDTNVATVSAKGAIRAISQGEADITVSNPDGTIKAVCKVTVAPKEEDNTPKTVAITAIKFAQAQMELKEGDLTVLEPEVSPEDATENVTWSSSDSEVATVSAKGAIRAVSQGETDITVSNPDGTVKAICKLTVVSKEEEATTKSVAITAIELNETSLELRENDSTVLEATVVPGDATEAVVWSSSNEDIASISNKGILTAKSEGTADISASNTDGTIKAVCKVVVAKAGLIKLEILSFAKESENITEGGSVVLDVVRTPANATENVTWSSDNEDVATVDSNGTIHGKSTGTATITAQAHDGEIKASCKINVVPYVKYITSIELEDHELTFSYSDMKNMTRALTSEVLPSDATEKPVWSSSDANVVKVDRNGTVTIVGAGTAVIKAESPSDPKVADECTINVLTDEQKKNIASSSIVVSEVKTVRYDGEPQKQDDMKLFDNDSNKALTYDVDYEVIYSPNVNAGIVTMTINGKGVYTGSRTQEFTITPYDVSGNASKETTRHYNSLNPNVGDAMAISVNGVQTIVKAGVDYDVDYGDSKLPGTRTIKYVFKGNYTGTINHTITSEVNAPKLKSVKKKGKKLVVQWTQPEYVDGYVVYRATKLKGKYKKVKTIKKAKTIKYTDSKVKKGKIYYYKVRAYVKAGGKTYYSSYTAVKGKKFK